MVETLRWLILQIYNDQKNARQQDEEITILMSVHLSMTNIVQKGQYAITTGREKIAKSAHNFAKASDFIAPPYADYCQQRCDESSDSKEYAVNSAFGNRNQMEKIKIVVERVLATHRKILLSETETWSLILNGEPGGTDQNTSMMKDNWNNWMHNMRRQ